MGVRDVVQDLEILETVAVYVRGAPPDFKPRQGAGLTLELEANLVEQPGHEPSIEAIIEVLEGAGIPVFQTADRALRTLDAVVRNRLTLDAVVRNRLG